MREKQYLVIKVLRKNKKRIRVSVFIYRSDIFYSFLTFIDCIYFAFHFFFQNLSIYYIKNDEHFIYRDINSFRNKEMRIILMDNYAIMYYYVGISGVLSQQLSVANSRSLTIKQNWKKVQKWLYAAYSVIEVSKKSLTFYTPYSEKLARFITDSVARDHLVYSFL